MSDSTLSTSSGSCRLARSSNPAAPAGPLVHAHAPALVVLGLQRPAARAARAARHPLVERRQHARALRLIVRVLQSDSTSAACPIFLTRQHACALRLVVCVLRSGNAHLTLC